LNRLAEWLKREPTGFWNILNVIIFYTLVAWVYSVAATFLAAIIGLYINDFDSPYYASAVWMLKFIIPLAIFEEFLFRFFPLAAANEIFRRNIYAVSIVAIVASARFGYLHGGWICVPIQGVGGLIFCLIFLKCGGYNRRYLKGLVSSSTAHILYNYSVVLISLFLGIKEMGI